MRRRPLRRRRGCQRNRGKFNLLWAFGAWETLEQMNAAMATRVYAATPDGKVGFRLVK